MTDKSVILGRPAGRNTAGKSPVSRNSDGKSPATGPPHGNLSEEEIVAAALRVVHEDGLDKLSMRRLSRELGVSAMAPYYYVSDKRELLDLVATAALAGIARPGPRRRLADPAADPDRPDRRPARPVPRPGRGAARADAAHAAAPGRDGDGDPLRRGVLRTERARRVRGDPHLPVRPQRDRQPGTLDPRPIALPEVIARAVRHLDKVHARDFYRFGAETLISGLGVQLDRQRSVSL